MWKLLVRTYEKQGGKDVLVLEHSFFGKTREEALHYSDSHAKTDSFYSGTGGALAARESHHLQSVVIVKGRYKGIETVTDAEFRKRKR